MALVRKDPLPKGFYWVEYGYQPGTTGTEFQSATAFEDWIRAHGDTVLTRTTEYDPDTNRTFRVFEVTEPTAYPAKQILFWPNEAKPGTTSQDVVQRPEPEPESKKSPVERAVGLGILVGVGMLAWRFLGVLAGSRRSRDSQG